MTQIGKASESPRSVAEGAIRESADLPQAAPSIILAATADEVLVQEDGGWGLHLKLKLKLLLFIQVTVARTTRHCS